MRRCEAESSSRGNRARVMKRSWELLAHSLHFPSLTQRPERFVKLHSPDGKRKKSLPGELFIPHHPWKIAWIIPSLAFVCRSRNKEHEKNCRVPERWEQCKMQHDKDPERWVCWCYGQTPTTGIRSKVNYATAASREHTSRCHYEQLLIFFLFRRALDDNWNIISLLIHIRAGDCCILHDFPPSSSIPSSAKLSRLREI